MRVLAVDDDSAGAHEHRRPCSRTSATRCCEANSGSEALEALKAQPDVDLVITDQAMPQMTGLQLPRGNLPQRPELPVMIATGYAELPMANGEFLKLDKPFFEQQLVKAIAAVRRGR